MQRYIKSDDALKTLRQLLYETALNQFDFYAAEVDVYEDIAKNRLETWIDLIPTADVMERKKGQWIRENIVLTSNPPQYQWHCSECGKMVHWFTTGVLTNFCPNCGADMRKEKEDEID